MNKNVMLLTGALALAAMSCGTNETQTVTETVTDTLVQTQVVEVVAPIDSAAVAAYYEAAHMKNKGTHQVAHKTQKGKKVRMDSHTIVEHHDVMAPVAAPAVTAAAPEAAPAAPATTTTEVIVVHDVEKVYFRPDEKATFPGGEKAFDEYLHKTLEYPSEALDKNVMGTVYAVVVLDEQGNISDVSFPGKPAGYGLEEEARRILMTSPRWNPARHGGVAVKSKFSIPITFEIQ